MMVKQQVKQKRLARKFQSDGKHHGKHWTNNKKGLVPNTMNSKLVIILLSDVLCKLLLLLLSLPPFISTFFLFMRIRWKSKCTHCLIMHIEAESNPRVKCKLRFVCRIDVPSLLGYHPSVCVIYGGINGSITDCLCYNTFSIRNRVCRVQPQLLCNISQRYTGIRYTDVA